MDSLEPNRAPHPTSKRNLRLYLLYCTMLPLLAYILPFVAERMPPLSRYSDTDYLGQVLDYSYMLRGEDADVLILGDSSALTGVDPIRLSNELGLKVINLPGTGGSLPITGDLPLRRYLAANRAPRLIVFYVDPWDLDVLAWKGPAKDFSGWEQMLRHGSRSDLLHLAIERKQEFFLFPFRYYATIRRLHKFPPAANGAPPPIESRGFVPVPETAPMAEDCSFPPWATVIRREDSTRDLLAAYGSARTITMAYLAPLPSCGHAEEAAGRRYTDLPLAPSRILPYQLFAADGHYVHPLPANVPVTTDLLAAAIRRTLDGRAANPPPSQ